MGLTFWALNKTVGKKGQRQVKQRIPLTKVEIGLFGGFELPALVQSQEILPLTARGVRTNQ